MVYCVRMVRCDERGERLYEERCNNKPTQHYYQVVLNYYQVVLHVLLLRHIFEETSIMARLLYLALVYEGKTANM
jgi:hypothetical protein